MLEQAQEELKSQEEAQKEIAEAAKMAEGTN